jgi:hypothetical protein
VTEPGITRGMKSDLDALERADKRFREEHGGEARARWIELGADGDGELIALQRQVAERRGAAPEVWDAFAWELELRVDLLEDARKALRTKRSGP